MSGVHDVIRFASEAGRLVTDGDWVFRAFSHPSDGLWQSCTTLNMCLPGVLQMCQNETVKLTQIGSSRQLAVNTLCHRILGPSVCGAPTFPVGQWRYRTGCTAAFERSLQQGPSRQLQYGCQYCSAADQPACCGSCRGYCRAVTPSPAIHTVRCTA
jgi:hypothetical protein